jgi:hypothetical protein
VTRGIFGDYLRTVISPDIRSWRERIGPDAQVMVIFDGRKAHLHAVLNAWAAADNIILCALLTLVTTSRPRFLWPPESPVRIIQEQFWALQNLRDSRAPLDGD